MANVPELLDALAPDGLTAYGRHLVADHLFHDQLDTDTNDSEEEEQIPQSEKTTLMNLHRSGLYAKIKMMTTPPGVSLKQNGKIKTIAQMSKKDLLTYIADTARQAKAEYNSNRPKGAAGVLMQAYAAIHQYLFPGYVDDMGIGVRQSDLDKLIHERGLMLAGFQQGTKEARPMQMAMMAASSAASCKAPSRCTSTRKVSSDMDETDWARLGVEEEHEQKHASAGPSECGTPKPAGSTSRVSIYTDINHVLLRRIMNILEVPREHLRMVVDGTEEGDKENILQGIAARQDLRFRGLEREMERQTKRILDKLDEKLGKDEQLRTV
eukprot:g14832.t1